MNNKRIKILYLITDLKTGGAETVLYRLLKNIHRDRFNPVVVSIIPTAEVGEKIKKIGIRVLSLNIKFKYNPFLFFRFVRILKQEKPVILHSFLFHSIFLGRIVGKICSVPIVISSIRSNALGGRFRDMLIRLTNRFDDVITIVSQDAEKEMVKKKIIPPDKTVVIYNGVDIKKFPIRNQEIKNEERKELGLQADRKILIAVGRLFRAKGYPYLIKSIKLLKNKYPNILLLILGEGEEREKLESQIKDLNLERNILLLGRKDNVVDYLEASDIFILSSLWEGLPNAVLEAMGCGLPVVATNVGGVPEIIQDNVNGFLVRSKDAKAMADRIEEVLNHLDDNEIEEVRRKARGTIEDKFSLRKMVENYESLYNRLLKSKNVY